MVRRMSAGCVSFGYRFALLVILASLLFTLTGCLGKGTSTQGHATVQSVTITPSTTASLELGATQTFSVTVKDNQGRTVTGIAVRFEIQNCPNNTCQSAPLAISSAGVACAGSWDPSFTICHPGVVGEALVTATAAGISSAATTVYVHQHIDSIQVSPIGNPQNDCFSQEQTFNYQATAFSNGADITSSVGQMNWVSSSTTVATTSTTVVGLEKNQAQVTAKTPGITQLTANVSGTTSNPVPYTTCLVKSIMLSLATGVGNTVTLAAGTSQALKATVIDTLNNTITLSSGLTWGTSDPEIAAVNSAGSVTAKQSMGGADIFAACTPPSCNIGITPSLPIYSTGGQLPGGTPGYGTIAVSVTAPTKPPTFVGWAATKDCYNQLNCSSVVFPITPGTSPIGASVTLSRTPNSMMFNPAGDRIYFGSDQGLMYVTPASPSTVTLVSSATSPCNVTLCGKVLAISDEVSNARVVVADTTSNPNQVYLYSSASNTAPVDLEIPNVTAAAFSPDEMKVFLFSSSSQQAPCSGPCLYVYSTVDALRLVPIANAPLGTAFSADGTFAYVAGEQPNSVSAFSTVSLSDLGGVATGSTPLLIVPSPNVQITPNLITQQVVAIEQPSDIHQPTNVQVLTSAYNGGLISSFTADPTLNLGQGNFTPLYARVVNSGSQVVIVGQYIPAVLLFDINSNAIAAFPLLNNGLPLAASASPDGSQIYVATCTGSQTPDDQGNLRCFTPQGGTPPGGEVQIVNTQAGGVVQEVPYANFATQNSMCGNLDPTLYPCTPDLIAVRPQ